MQKSMSQQLHGSHVEQASSNSLCSSTSAWSIHLSCSSTVALWNRPISRCSRLECRKAPGFDPIAATLPVLLIGSMTASFLTARMVISTAAPSRTKNATAWPILKHGPVRNWIVTLPFSDWYATKPPP